ncbi:MAG: hypothetical protein Q7S33_04805 [Nanoarchaeota archaeon]|nr:hypothetical protein [Nanoarchaeota archaeon]
MIKAIVWDIGGVLVEDPKVDDFWKNKSDSKELRKEFGSGKLSATEFIKKGSKLLDVSEEKFLENYKKAYFSIKLIKNSFEIFKKSKIPNYILSDTNPLHTDFLEKNFPDLFSNCKKTFLSTYTGHRKSEPKTFKFIIEQLKLKPNEILFIDNKEEFTKEASRLGIQTIHYKDSENLKKEINKLI